MAGKLIHIFKRFLDLLFPQKCLGCGISGAIICESCLMSFPPFLAENKSPHLLAGYSGRWGDKPPNLSKIDEIFAATSYENKIVKNTIWLFKYRNVKALAEPLSILIVKKIGDKITHLISNASQTAVIIPIPLSRKKLKKRGYNQAEILGKCLSDKLSIKIETDVLYKTKETISQVEIKDRDKRLKNIQGVFAVKNPEIIRNKIIILVDDITTTGATLNEASRVLKQAGSGKIIGLTVAKG